MTATNMTPWQGAIASAKDRFTAIALESESPVLYAKESMFAMQAIQKNSYLMDIANQNPDSLRDAVINVAAIGLSLNPAEKLAYLVPRDGGACLDISYMGLIKLATDTGSILWAKAELVYADDQFVYKGPAEKPEHHANVFGTDRGDPVGVYCVAKTRDGEYLVETMSRQQVMEIKAKSKGSDKAGSAWQTFPGEMWKKVNIKRASKTWPRTDRTKRFDEAVHIVNQHEGLADEYIAGPESGPEPGPTITISEDQALTIETTIKDNGMNMELFCNMVERKTGSREINSLPADSFDPVMQILNDKVASKQRAASHDNA